MSKFNFSFRRSERNAFKHIAHGLIPAATIAPRPAVPRTPPPRSLSPSPERPRSALAAAILSSSLTGRTVAIPPARTRSLSETDCSRSEHQQDFQPFASTALYTRDRWSDPVGSRPRCPSPGRSDEDDDDDDDDEEEEDEGLEEEVLSEDGHVYQSVENPVRSPAQDAIYAVPSKLRASYSDGDELTEDSTFDIVSPLHTEEEIEEEPTEKQRSAHPRLSTPTQLRRSSPPQRRTPSPTHTSAHTHTSSHTSRHTSRHTSKHSRSSSKVMPSPGRRDAPAEVMETSRKQQQQKRSPDTARTGSEAGEAYRETLEVQKELVQTLREQLRGLGGEKQALRGRCEEQSHLLQDSQQRILALERELSSALRDNSPLAGETAELQSLRQQAQELVDENDALKMTVHRLNVELSHYQTRFRPLSKQETARTSGIPVKGPPPPWLLDMKYLSPLLLAYEDRLMEKDTLLQSCEEEVRKLRVQTEEVVKENEKLYEQLGRMGGISHQEWKQLQEQARLVLEENQVLLEQLEVQRTKAKENHTRHHQEVAKVSKQLVLQEDELLRLQRELEDTRRELHTLQHQEAVTHEQHQSNISQLTQRLEEEKRCWQGEMDELLGKMAALQTERKALVRIKTELDANTKSLEAELELARHAHRKAQRRVEVLKQQLEESMDKELTALHYLAGVVGLAEKTTLERDQLVHMLRVNAGEGQAGRHHPHHRGHRAARKAPGEGQGRRDAPAEVMETSRKQQQQKRSPDTARTGSEAGEAYRETLEVQKELVQTLREQLRGLGGEKQALRGRCEEQSHLLQDSQQRILALERELSSALRDNSPLAGETAELQSLRQQAQELVDENDALKMTVHRLNVELSHYQTRFRPLSKQETARTSGIPVKGPPPPWLLDMKYLSPLLLAYEDRLMEKDTLLQSCEEEVRKLRVQTEEVVKENEKLHEQLGRMGGISHQEWKQLQEQARLVLEENQVLLEQLEVQRTKAKENHTRHHQEVAKVSKQLVLQEDELLRLQRELEDTRRELHTLQHQEAVTHEQHQSNISQLTQ
ncbi:centrosomal protein of 89 kDa [Clupea harengus]|uniref:Centrosomal protein of 89 kDa n=1 Tax=Clupea harengus TaxID=7950 RepID=A0A6P8GY29_CLUHA|nr:centrosomal protein of 89 kDa [Clupea harengus]